MVKSRRVYSPLRLDRLLQIAAQYADDLFQIFLALFGAWSWRAGEQSAAPPSKAGAVRTAQSFDLGEPAHGTLQTTPTAEQPSVAR